MVAWLLAVTVLAAGAGCGGNAGSSSESAGDPSRMRIVALGGSITEIVYALGAGDHLVGVDLSSSYPDSVARLPKVGYQRTISAEPILSLGPTIVLATEESGPNVALDQIRESGTIVTVVPSSDHSLAGAERKIRAVGDALGRRAAAETLIDSLDRKMSMARSRVAGLQSLPSVMFIYTRGPGGAQIAGHGTAADAMIALAGARNAVAGYQGYRALTAEAVAGADPEIILVPAEALEMLGGIDALLELPGLATTRAGRARRVIAMDDLELLGFGPRLAEAVTKLIDALHRPASGGGA